MRVRDVDSEDIESEDTDEEREARFKQLQAEKLARMEKESQVPLGWDLALGLGPNNNNGNYYHHQHHQHHHQFSLTKSKSGVRRKPRWKPQAGVEVVVKVCVGPCSGWGCEDTTRRQS